MISTARCYREFGIHSLQRIFCSQYVLFLFLIPIFYVKMRGLEKERGFAKIAEYDIHCLHSVEGSRQKLETPIEPPQKKMRFGERKITKLRFGH